jgi:hypothetical protein
LSLNTCRIRLLLMKKDPKKIKRKSKMTLAKESVRKLSSPDLANAVGGQQTATVTFPKCCLTL